MKKHPIFVLASFLVFTLFCSSQLSAQWSQLFGGGGYLWTTNPNIHVGIGTSTPSHGKLQFDNVLGNKITLWGGGPYNYGFGVNASNLVAYIADTPDDRFSVRLNGYDGPEKFMVTSEGNIGLNGAVPYYSRMQFDNALGNKISFFDLGGNVGFGMGVTGSNLSAFIPNLPNQRFSIRLDNSTGAEKFMVWSDGAVYAGKQLSIGATGTATDGTSLLQFQNASGAVIRSSIATTPIGNAPLSIEAASLSFKSSNNLAQLVVTSAGNVGIGTTNPTYKLAVNGTIRAKEVRVETGWADYVFEPHYNLRPLAEVEKYIRENQHLPDVTSADDIQKDGLQVGEQMTQMMRKIEELTLYVIDLKKENEAMKTQLSHLEPSKK